MSALRRVSRGLCRLGPLVAAVSWIVGGCLFAAASVFSTNAAAACGDDEANDAYSYARRAYSADTLEDCQDYARRAKSSAEDAESEAGSCN